MCVLCGRGSNFTPEDISAINEGDREGSGFVGLLCCYSGGLSGQESERSFLNALYRD